jgi:hypothetical protein
MGGRTQEVKMNGHVLPSYDARVIRFPSPDGAGRKVRSDRHGATTPDKNRPKPGWHVLYIAVALTILFFVVAEVESPVGGWRILTECLGTGLIIGVMALWVRANRAALALADATQYGGRSLESSVAYSPRQSSVPRLDACAIEFRQRSRAQTRPAEEEDATCFAK